MFDDHPVSISPAAAPVSRPGLSAVPAPTEDGMLASTAAVTVPGPGTAHLLDDVDVSRLAEHELVETVAGWQRLISWAQARQAQVLAELVRRPAMRPESVGHSVGFAALDPVVNVAADVAGRLTMTMPQARRLVGEAVQLVEDFPAAHAAMAAGELDSRRAKVIAEELGGQDQQVAARVETAVASPAADWDTTRLRRELRRKVVTLAPDEAEQRRARAKLGRFVRVCPAGDGMAWLEALLPAEDAVAVKTALDAAADVTMRTDREAGRAARTADQRRADALARFGWASLWRRRLATAAPDQADGVAPAAAPAAESTMAGAERRVVAHPGPSSLADEPTSWKRRPVTVNVTIPLSTLAGVDDQPAELEGYGPLPAQVGRQLATAGVWRWVGTDPATGRVLDFGLTRYRPSRTLIDLVVLRDRTCVAPGCHAPAKRCDIDHRVRFGEGPTAACNCVPLCRTHHLLKHRARWRLAQPRPGMYEWTSPSGHRYRTQPEPVGPVAEAPGPDGRRRLSAAPGDDPPGAGPLPDLGQPAPRPPEPAAPDPRPPDPAAPDPRPPDPRSLEPPPF